MVQRPRSFPAVTSGGESSAEAQALDRTRLAALGAWRVQLAQHALLRNPRLGSEQLDLLAQRLIYRMLFVRIGAERRALSGAWARALAGPGLHARLTACFEAEGAGGVAASGAAAAAGSETGGGAGGRTGLAPVDPARRGTELPVAARLGDALLARVRAGIERLAAADGAVRVETLGLVHEHFRGSALEVGPSGVRLAPRPARRKAEGVYYTPPHVVRFMVDQTLAPLFEKGADAGDLRVLDPACGAGWFLLVAFRTLLRRRMEDAREAGTGGSGAVATGGGRPRLSFRERRRILLASIHGIDLDPLAVEVARLSLLLELGDGRSVIAPGATDSEAGAGAVLAALAANVTCGNALLEPACSSDGSEEHDGSSGGWRRGAAGSGRTRATTDGRAPRAQGGEGTAARRRPDRAGYDAVLGNPPYLKEYTSREPFRQVRGTRLGRYYQGKMDLWQLFACLALDLLRPGGRHAFIAPSSWTASAGASRMREKLLGEARLERFVDFGAARIFRSAGIQTAIYVVEKNAPAAARETRPTRPRPVPAGTVRPRRGSAGGAPVASGVAGEPAPRVHYARLVECDIGEGELAADLAADRLEPPRWLRYDAVAPRPGKEAFTLVDDGTSALLDAVERGPRRRLGPRDVAQGIVLPQERVTPAQRARLLPREARVGEGIFLLTPEEARRVCKSAAERALLRPYYTTEQLGRFRARREHRLWLLYTTREVEHGRTYASVRAHLDRFQPIITSSNKPYGLHRPRDPYFFSGPRIVALRKTAVPCFAYVDFPAYVSQTFNVIKPRAGEHDLLFLTGLLSSRLAHFWLWHRGKRQGDQLQVDKQPLLRFPIRAPRDGPQTAAARVVAACAAKLAGLPAAGAGESARRREEIARCLDRAVYALYGLGREQVALLERATPRPRGG